MIKSCARCGGLYTTVNMESFAGTPCRCPVPDEGYLRVDQAAAGEEFVPVERQHGDVQVMPITILRFLQRWSQSTQCGCTHEFDTCCFKVSEPCVKCEAASLLSQSYVLPAPTPDAEEEARRIAKVVAEKLCDEQGDANVQAALLAADPDALPTALVNLIAPLIAPALSSRSALSDDLLRRGRECAVWITGDPDDAQSIQTSEQAWAAIDEAIRLGVERNNELNALRLSAAQVLGERYVTAILDLIIPEEKENATPWNMACVRAAQEIKKLIPTSAPAVDRDPAKK